MSYSSDRLMMKKLLLIISLVYCIAIPGLSQRQYLSFEGGLSKNYKGFYTLYKGILNIGGSYQLRVYKPLYAGMAFRINYFRRANTTAGLTLYKPGINVSAEIPVIKRIKIVLRMGAGYAFLRNTNREFGYKETQTGINSTAELNILWITKDKFDYYIFGRYDHIYLDEDTNFTRLEYYRNINTTDLGIGIRIK